VSNKRMRSAILVLLFPLLAFCLRAQGPSLETTETTAIERVKVLLISSLDRSLPKVTLEFFLRYEGAGAPIQWEVNDCGEQNMNAGDRGHASGKCVQANIALKDGRAVAVVILIEEAKKAPTDIPTVHGVRVTGRDGTIHRLLQLGDLPVELHRPVPKGPKDLPSPAAPRVA